jgi:flagellin-like protein
MKMKYLKFGTNRKILKDDRGVSPVIAVILMVAITVVMAAIVSSWSAGVKAPTTPTTVGLDISRDANNITVVVTAIDPVSSVPLTALNASLTNNSGLQNYINMSSVDVGHMGTMDTGDSTLHKLVVTATFKDGTRKVLYSRDT